MNLKQLAGVVFIRQTFALLWQSQRMTRYTSIQGLFIYKIFFQMSIHFSFFFSFFHRSQRTILNKSKVSGCVDRHFPLIMLTSDGGVVSLHRSHYLKSSETEGQGSANPLSRPSLWCHSDAVFLLQFPDYHRPACQCDISSVLPQTHSLGFIFHRALAPAKRSTRRFSKRRFFVTRSLDCSCWHEPSELKSFICSWPIPLTLTLTHLGQNIWISTIISTLFVIVYHFKCI